MKLWSGSFSPLKGNGGERAGLCWYLWGDSRGKQSWFLRSTVCFDSFVRMYSNCWLNTKKKRKKYIYAWSMLYPGLLSLLRFVPVTAFLHNLHLLCITVLLLSCAMFIVTKIFTKHVSWNTMYLEIWEFCSTQFRTVWKSFEIEKLLNWNFKSFHKRWSDIQKVYIQIVNNVYRTFLVWILHFPRIWWRKALIFSSTSDGNGDN